MKFSSHSQGRKKWFGSPDKKSKGGIKDDAIYSLAWAIKGITGDITPMTDRHNKILLGEVYINTDVVGDYR